MRRYSKGRLGVRIYATSWMPEKVNASSDEANEKRQVTVGVNAKESKLGYEMVM